MIRWGWLPLFGAAAAATAVCAVATDRAGSTIPSAEEEHLLTSSVELESLTSEPDAVILLAVLPWVPAHADSRDGPRLEKVAETWDELRAVLDARWPWPEEKQNAYQNILTVQKAVLRALLPTQVSSRFCFASSSRNARGGGGESDDSTTRQRTNDDDDDETGSRNSNNSSGRRGDCSELAASLGVVDTPTVLVLAGGIRRRLPDFAAVDGDELAAYARWLVAPAVADVGGGTQTQADDLVEYAANRLGKKRLGVPAAAAGDRYGRAARMLVIEVHRTMPNHAAADATTGAPDADAASGDSVRSVSAVGRAARRRVDHHGTIAYAEIAWTADTAVLTTHPARPALLKEGGDAHASVVVATTCSGPEIVACVETALLSESSESLQQGQPASAGAADSPGLPASAPLCCLGSLPVKMHTAVQLPACAR